MLIFEVWSRVFCGGLLDANVGEILELDCHFGSCALGLRDALLLERVLWDEGKFWILSL